MHSVVFRTWLSFVLLAVCMVGCLWGAQLLLFRVFYQSVKRGQVVRSCEAIVDGFFPAVEGDFEKYENEIADRAAEHAMLAFIYYRCGNTAEHDGGDDAHIITYAVSFIGDRVGYREGEYNDAYVTGLSEEFTSKLAERKAGAPVSYERSVDGELYKIYGDSRILNTAVPLDGVSQGSEIYFYFLASLHPPSLMSAVVFGQLMAASALCLVIGVLLAYVISKFTTKPISQFGETAKRLSQGDYSVVFKGYGYTEYDELAKTLNGLTDEMSKTENLRRELLANVSHDLRTPLTMIRAYAEMIRDISGKNEKKRTEHSQVIIDETDRLSNLVADILNLSKLQSGTESVNLTRNDLAELAHTVVKRFDYLSVRDGYHFSFESAGDCTVLCDENKINQSIYNLIGNAVNYTGPDKCVSVSVKREGEYAVFRVTDTGKGIAPAEIEAVWEKYYRVSFGRRNVVGSGLGLSIVKTALNMHGAKFGVISELNVGSTFWFSLKTVTSATTKNAKKKEF